MHVGVGSENPVKRRAVASALEGRGTDATVEAVAVDSQATGSMQWGADQWGASEWNPRAP